MELTVSDLARSVWCRRLPYYRLVLPLRPAPTRMMTRGRQAHANEPAREVARGWEDYGLGGCAAERVFGLRLRSARLALSGQLDLLVRTADAAYPVDFKSGAGPVSASHRMQLAAYAALVEDALRLPVPRGFIRFLDSGELCAVELGRVERGKVLRRAASIRRMVARERLPPPTKVRSRCEACEFRNYCGDVW